MTPSNSRIDPQDAVILFADLQSGIFELSKTIPPDRLKTGVRGLAKLAKLLGIPAIVSVFGAKTDLQQKSFPKLQKVLAILLSITAPPATHF